MPGFMDLIFLHSGCADGENKSSGYHKRRVEICPYAKKQRFCPESKSKNEKKAHSPKARHGYRVEFSFKIGHIQSSRDKRYAAYRKTGKIG